MKGQEEARSIWVDAGKTLPFTSDDPVRNFRLPRGRLLDNSSGGSVGRKTIRLGQMMQNGSIIEEVGSPGL